MQTDFFLLFYLIRLNLNATSSKTNPSNDCLKIFNFILFYLFSVNEFEWHTFKNELT